MSWEVMNERRGSRDYWEDWRMNPSRGGVETIVKANEEKLVSLRYVFNCRRRDICFGMRNI